MNQGLPAVIFGWLAGLLIDSTSRVYKKRTLIEWGSRWNTLHVVLIYLLLAPLVSSTLRVSSSSRRLSTSSNVEGRRSYLGRYVCVCGVYLCVCSVTRWDSRDDIWVSEVERVAIILRTATSDTHAELQRVQTFTMQNHLRAVSTKDGEVDEWKAEAMLVNKSVHCESRVIRMH